MRVVVKIGTSSLTDESGRIDAGAVAKIAAEVAALRVAGHDVVVVSSGAISAGLPALGLEGRRPSDMPTLQAIAAVGQHRLMARWDAAFGAHGVDPGQVLLAPLDFVHRQQYLHARQTLERLLELGFVPVVNENDAVADDEIRFGDNDRLAALVAHLLRADLLVLLTDTAGLLTADPRLDAGASLIEEVREVDARLEELAGAAGSERGSGGMASKLAAARIATWSGVTTVIASARAPRALRQSLSGAPGFGTTFHPRASRLSARKAWIAFAVASRGSVRVNDGARQALVRDGRSLLRVGVVAVEGDFVEGDALEVVDARGDVIAKGLARVGADEIDQGEDVVVHRDDLVLLRDV